MPLSTSRRSEIIRVGSHDAHVAVQIAVVEDMAGLHQVDVVLQDAFRSPYLWLLALDFKRIAVQQPRPETQLIFEKSDIFITSAK